MSKVINGTNGFYLKAFNQMVEELKKGEEIEVYIDCIGHTRNNMEQMDYKRHLEERFGDRLISTYIGPDHCFSYKYKLKDL